VTRLEEQARDLSIAKKLIYMYMHIRTHTFKIHRY